MQIRREQLEALENAAARRFESEIVEHVREFAPRLFSILGEPAVRAFARNGIVRAAKYGFSQRGPAKLYVEMMLSFGTEFDSDPQLPWASQVLSDQAPMEPMLRAELLYREMLKYVHRVAGPGNQFALEALKRFQRSRPEDLEAAPGEFTGKMVRAFAALYPEKAQYAGEPVLRQLVTTATARAVAAGVTAERGRAVIAGLMFGFGHGILDDPLYPWVAATLNEPPADDGNVRALRLYEKARLYADHMLKNMGSEAADS